MMDGFTEQLGVKCTFCHVLDLKAKKADYFGPGAKEAVIACGMCHRGKATPEVFVGARHGCG